MIAMQYKISLPVDYDMSIIRNRIIENGYKTDGFEDLLFKAYLFSDKENKKEYSPLYIWKQQQGMNKFIFEGYYNNILDSFGWQTINIAIPVEVNISEKIKDSRYVLEIYNDIEPSKKMNKPTFTYKNENCLGKVLVYNPDKWKYAEFYFYDKLSCINKNKGSVYETLHISF